MPSRNYFLFSVVCFVCLRPVSSVLYVDCFSGWSILDFPSDSLSLSNYFNKVNHF